MYNRSPANFRPKRKARKELSMSDTKAGHWNWVARGWSLRGYSNELLAEHKIKTYHGLIAT